jgi:hypothetical protein
MNLCAFCMHAKDVRSAKGSVFTVCTRSLTDARFPRYPTLPVTACTGFDAPLVVEFALGSSLVREHDRPSDLPIHRNGPPGTFVHIGTTRVSLPTDQIVSVGDVDGAAAVGFGGMRFTGVEEGQLTFERVGDLWPEHLLSPARSWRMTLDPSWVASVREHGKEVWPVSTSAPAAG